MLATRYGVAAYELARSGRFGRMTALRGDDIVPIPLSEVTGIKTVPPDLMDIARRFYA